MRFMSHIGVRNASVLLVLALGFVLASCGGDGEGAIPGEAPEGIGEFGQPASATGRLTVTVTDPDGRPLANARVQLTTQQRPVPHVTSNQDGQANFESLPQWVRVRADHALGYYPDHPFEVQQAGTTNVTVAVQPFLPPTIALLPVVIPPGSISADRTELELHVSISASAAAPFVPSSIGTNGATSLPTPYLRLGDCWVWLDVLRITPACDFINGNAVTVVDYSYDRSPALSAVQGTYNALLLLDQSRRVAQYDPHNLRLVAAKSFIRRARFTPQPDLIAVAAFAGQGGNALLPPLLPQLPLWLPFSAATVFASEGLAQEVVLDSLQSLVGGSAPLFAALQAAFDLTASSAPATGQRAVVALVGGGDDSGVPDSQRQTVLASLRQQQVETGIQTILIAGRLDQDSAERRNLAELAAMLRAPIIYSGYPKDWDDSEPDGLYSALNMATEMLEGESSPSVKAVFRLQAEPSASFQSGTTLRGTLWVETDKCPFGCREVPLDFAVEIP